MDLYEILARTAQGLVAVDAATQRVNRNRRSGEPYLPGAPTLTEPQFVEELSIWWLTNHRAEFCTERPLQLEFPYESGDEACDLVIRSHNFDGPHEWEWAIEYKYIRLVGNNGKNNDYGVSKALSPYRKDRSFVHDATRLSRAEFAQKKAAIIYGFEYDADSVSESARFCAENGAPDYSANIRSVIRSVDPISNRYLLGPLEEIITDHLVAKGLSNLPAEKVAFSGAVRHPCGGRGLVIGWQIA